MAQLAPEGEVQGIVKILRCSGHGDSSDNSYYANKGAESMMTNIFCNSFWNNNFRVRFCVIILGVLSMVSVATESMGQQFEITPFAGYRFGGDFEDSGTGVGLAPRPPEKSPPRSRRTSRRPSGNAER